MKVITISGKAQHGKDTAAMMLKKQLESTGNSVLVTHYADLVKYVCTNFFNWNGVKDEYGRTLLQRVGTDIVRKKCPDYWVNFVVQMLTFFDGAWDYVLIPDCRFPNEVDCMKNAPHNLENGWYAKVLMDAPHNRSFDEESIGAVRMNNWSDIYDYVTAYGEQMEEMLSKIIMEVEEFA